MVTYSSNNTTAVRYTSTLLIPEETVWLPYVGLVLTVVVWLGYDFYRFHGKNKQKYARAEEHLTILRAVPSNQRISMVSGIGLKFRRGKPILGDVWNTSPSSSDMSTCYVPRRRHALVSYSREVTPSDDEGKNSESDVFEESKTGSCADLVRNEVHNTHHKGWNFGEDFVKGRLNKRSSHDEKEHDYQSAYPETKESIYHRTGASSSRASLSSGSTSTTETFYTGDNQNSAWASEAGVEGDVDDDGGGGFSRYSRDVSTQTTYDELMMNAPSECKDILHPGNPFFYTAHTLYATTSHSRPQRGSEGTESATNRHYSVGTPEHSSYATAPVTASRSSSDARPMDIPHNSTLPKYTGGKSDRRHLPPLRLDLMSGPYSPTSEIVASKHGFALEGLEVPLHSGSGSRGLPSSDNDMFKSANSRSSNHSSNKPLSPSPAVSRMPSPHPMSPRQSSIHSNDHPTFSKRSQRHRQKRQESQSVTSSGHPPSKSNSISKKPPQTIAASSRQNPRAMSSSPRMLKDYEEAMSLKTFKDSSIEPPMTAPIPTHMYHEDEEGFFSSVHSASHSRRYKGETDEYNNKGILFFSRLAGIGRHQDGGAMGSGGKPRSGGYRSGGFES